MKHIVCFHLFNDYSGSPKVLAMVLEGLLQKRYCIDLITSKHGALNSLYGKTGIVFHTCHYRFSKNPLITLLLYVTSQIYTFFFSFRYLFRKDVVFYINTILPIAPALAGKLMGKKVVYHYHENAFIKGKFYRLLAFAMQKLADEIICVSEYQRSLLPRKKHVEVIYNALPLSFSRVFETEEVKQKPTGNVLMLSSLKIYKGIVEFVALAKALPEIFFELVINADKEDIDRFWVEHDIALPQNLNIFPRQTDVVSFYKRASLVLNLSNKEKILETFGLTVLEAFTAGVPVIVPTKGGIAELVEDRVTGYKIDIQELDKIKNTIKNIFSDRALFHSLALNAKREAEKYSYENMISRISSLL